MKLLRALGTLVLAVLSPLILLVSAVALGLVDIWFALFGGKRLTQPSPARNRAASVVIPNWNGRDLLEKYLPSVISGIAFHPGSEVIVVDNGSTDGSEDFVLQQFPEVRVLALPRNLGFGGGSNAGFLAAKNDIVV